jgi:G3E family GTPase
MVTVVDAARFLEDFQSIDDLKDRQAALGDNDERTVSDLLIDQIEFASVIVINKCDLVTTSTRCIFTGRSPISVSVADDRRTDCSERRNGE